MPTRAHGGDQFTEEELGAQGGERTHLAPPVSIWFCFGSVLVLNLGFFVLGCFLVLGCFFLAYPFLFIYLCLIIPSPHRNATCIRTGSIINYLSNICHCIAGTYNTLWHMAGTQ